MAATMPSAMIFRNCSASRTTHRTQQPLADGVHDFAMHNLHVPTRVEHDHALGLAPRDLQISVANAGKERTVLLLKTVFIALGEAVTRGVAAPGTLHAGRRIGIHEDSQVGKQSAANHAMQIEDGGAS